MTWIIIHKTPSGVQNSLRVSNASHPIAAFPDESLVLAEAMVSYLNRYCRQNDGYFCLERSNGFVLPSSDAVMFRCTRSNQYEGKNCPGANNTSERQGHYIKVGSRPESLLVMHLMNPYDQDQFTSEH